MKRQSSSLEQSLFNWTTPLSIVPPAFLRRLIQIQAVQAVHQPSEQ
jgi:hypothetical protein